MIRDIANTDLIGRIVKLYKNPSRHKRAPNSVTYDTVSVGVRVYKSLVLR